MQPNWPLSVKFEEVSKEVTKLFKVAMAIETTLQINKIIDYSKAVKTCTMQIVSLVMKSCALIIITGSFISLTKRDNSYN